MTLYSLSSPPHYDHPVGNEAQILLANALALFDSSRGEQWLSARQRIEQELSTE